MKSLKDIDVAGKRVLVRVDFNVPLDDQRQITDDTRIRFALPTLEHLTAAGAKTIVCSHLGRPKGKPDPVFGLAPAAARLGELLKRPVKMLDACVGPEVTARVDAMAPGDVVMLENLRFHPGEANNDDVFAKELAGLCDVYVNDAFAVSHRANASVEAITKFAPASVAGFLLEKELSSFARALKKPARPLVAVVGGAKVSSKLTALNNLLAVVDRMIIGGAMANTFLAAKGVNVGKSKIEQELIGEAMSVMQQASEKKVEFFLPVDVIVAEKIDPNADRWPVPADQIPEQAMALDIGPETCRLFADALKDVKTIVWNGPMGIFEMEAFAVGTKAVAAAVADSDAFSVVGGGDTVSAINEAGVADRISYISTGGGAFLELMEGKTLPGVAALER
ncbi:MAG: phosphoglycerate kinase [Thermodesulfobacteriota bacterium]|nr:phosphoglycerate kinase [Thermodesulfobacteriota bacterium]